MMLGGELIFEDFPIAIEGVGFALLIHDYIDCS